MYHENDESKHKNLSGDIKNTCLKQSFDCSMKLFNTTTHAFGRLLILEQNRYSATKFTGLFGQVNFTLLVPPSSQLCSIQSSPTSLIYRLPYPLNNQYFARNTFQWNDMKRNNHPIYNMLKIQVNLWCNCKYSPFENFIKTSLNNIENK
ncbi:hypothetical protein I4U23_031183 [Adineta vaga]|nr:hypothetical protein I4U23_031183 [Adineta vaga]